MKLSEGMICPVCEEGTLGGIRRKVKFVYKGIESEVEGRVFECNQCGESFWDHRDEREVERMLTDERRKTDALLTSDEIRNIRRNFGFSQAQFAKLLGIGDKNFARYETGASMQGRTTDHLLRILMNIPEALAIIAREIPEWETRKEIQATVQKMDAIPTTVIAEVTCSVAPAEDEYYADAV